MAVDDELIMRSPARKVQLFPEQIPDVHILTFEEEFKYLALASEPLKSVAIIMLGQGMRPNEVFRMAYENLDFVNQDAGGSGPVGDEDQTQLCLCDPS